MPQSGAKLKELAQRAVRHSNGAVGDNQKAMAAYRRGDDGGRCVQKEPRAVEIIIITPTQARLCASPPNIVVFTRYAEIEEKLAWGKELVN